MSVPGYSEAKHKGSAKIDNALADLPSGPLDIYRRRASFNWKDMVMFLEGEDVLEFKVSCENKCVINML